MNMPPSEPLVVPLVCHPATPTAAVHAVAVRIAWGADGALALDYAVTAEPEAILLPPPAAAAPADGLWAHTCAEAFVAAAGAPAYREFNFSPSTQWAVYAFGAYRERTAAPAAVTPPRIALRRQPGALTLSARVAADALAAAAGTRMQLGLSLVVEEAGGSASYWALRHPGARPDFHHRDAFALEIVVPHVERTP